MAEATRLTQAGNLMGATALIQRLLQGGDAAEPADTGSGSPTIIDVEAVVLDDTDPGVWQAVAHLAALVVGYGALARLALRRFG